MAVLVNVAFLQREGFDVILDMGLAPFLHPRQVVGVGEVEDGEFLQLRFRVAENPAKSRVGFDDFPAQLAEHHGEG